MSMYESMPDNLVGVAVVQYYQRKSIRNQYNLKVCCLAKCSKWGISTEMIIRKSQLLGSGNIGKIWWWLMKWIDQMSTWLLNDFYEH